MAEQGVRGEVVVVGETVPRGENKAKPSRLETKPQGRTDTVKNLGKTAIKGANKK